MVSAGVDGDAEGSPLAGVDGDDEGDPDGDPDGDAGSAGEMSDGPGLSDAGGGSGSGSGVVRGSTEGAVVDGTVGTGPRPPEVVQAAMRTRSPARAGMRARGGWPVMSDGLRMR